MLKRFMTPCPVQVDLLRGQQRTSPLCEEEEDVPSMMKMEIRMTMCPAGLLCEQRLNSDLDLWFTFTFTRWSEVKDKHTWEVSIYPQTVVKFQYLTGETDRKLNQTGRKVKTSFTQEGLETQESIWQVRSIRERRGRYTEMNPDKKEADLKTKADEQNNRRQVEEVSCVQQLMKKMKNDEFRKRIPD